MDPAFSAALIAAIITVIGKVIDMLMDKSKTAGATTERAIDRANTRIDKLEEANSELSATNADLERQLGTLQGSVDVLKQQQDQERRDTTRILTTIQVRQRQLLSWVGQVRDSLEHEDAETRARIAGRITAPLPDLTPLDTVDLPPWLVYPRKDDPR